jgi:hypothetical protein
MPSRNHALFAAAAACAALAIPATASAKDFCVGGPAGCSGTPVAADGLKAALTAAESNGTDDRFILAPGTYTADELSYQSLEKMRVIGAGGGKTTVETTGVGAFKFGGNPGSSITGITFHPADAAEVGLFLTAGASLSHSRVNVGDDGWAVVTTDQGTVTDSVIDAPHGAAIVAAGTEMTVRRSTLRAFQGATVAKGHLAVSDTLIDLRANTFGIGVNAAGGSNLGTGVAAADVDRVTIVGSNPSGTDIAGVVAQGDGAGSGGVVRMRDSVISGIGLPVARQGRTGATANVTTDRSSYGANVTPFDSGPGQLIEHNRLIVSPQFVGNGDFHLAAGSPLIDAGTPGSVPAGAVDRDGRPRASDGNGDCTRVSDIGAFEYQGTKVKAVAHASAAATTGTPVPFTAAGSCVPGPEAPTIRWRFDDGALAAGASAAHAYATPGRHVATVTVTDAHGHSAQASAAVTVTAPPVAPKITRLRVTHGRVRFRLSQTATVTLRIAKVGKRPRTTLHVNAHQGANKIRLRKTLKPGRYRLTAVATTTTGQHSKRVATRFKVV